MAVQIETQGQLAEFLEILGRRRWQFLLPAALLLSLGIALAVFVPKKFLVTTQVEVRQVGTSTSGKEAENAPNQIRAIERIRKVVEQLKNPAYLALPPLQQNEFVKDVHDDVRVKTDKQPGASSTFLTIDYIHVDKAWAMSFLKALRDDWKKDVIDRDQDKANDDEKKANEEVAALEKASRQKEGDLSRLYRQYNISPTQPIPGGNEQRNEDPEYERLQRSRDELDKTVLALVGAEQAVASLQKSLDDTPERLSEEQVLEGSSNAAEILDLELKIEEQNNQLKRYNSTASQYRIIQKKLKELEDKRDQIKKLATRGELTSLQKPNPQHAVVRLQLDNATLERDKLLAKKQSLEAKIKSDTQDVGALYVVYQDITNLRKETNLLDAQLEAATLKRDEKVRIARALASRLSDPFSITQEVLEPAKPTEPNPWLIVAFALVAGLALGLSIALTAEYGRNCFRSVHDVSRVMVAPVLGNVGSILTSRQRRLRALQRALVGGFSATLIAALLFVTWAWASNPELLSPQLRARIQQVCDKLR